MSSPKVDKAIEELKKVGYTDEKVNELLELLLSEIADQVFLDLSGTATDEQIEALRKKAKTAEVKA